MDAAGYWRGVAQTSQNEVQAACRAVGAAGYFLGPYGPATCTERLARLGDVIAELRQALGLDDLDTTQLPNDMKGRDL